MDKFVKVDRAITILVPPLEEGICWETRRSK
jgi:hypothetical protein